MQITNATSRYTCQINPKEVQYTQHAHGDCSIPANASAFSIPVTSSSLATSCGDDDTVRTTFNLLYELIDDLDFLLIGSISELGLWDPSQAILMGRTGVATWIATVDIPAGTDFEYKYLSRSNNGSNVEAWECCENRIDSTPAGTCGNVTVGNDPDYFRGGGDPVVA